MAALAFIGLIVAALVALDWLALRFGADSRLGSPEHRPHTGIVLR
jgi:hypothetical protein